MVQGIERPAEASNRCRRWGCPDTLTGSADVCIHRGAKGTSPSKKPATTQENTTEKYVSGVGLAEAVTDRPYVGYSQQNSRDRGQPGRTIPSIAQFDEFHKDQFERQTTIMKFTEINSNDKKTIARLDEVHRYQSERQKKNPAGPQGCEELTIMN